MQTKISRSGWQSATNVLKTDPKKAIQKTAEATSDLTDDKIADKITKAKEYIHQRIYIRLI